MSFASGFITTFTPVNGSDIPPLESTIRIAPGSRSVTRIFPSGRNAMLHGA